MDPERSLVDRLIGLVVLAAAFTVPLVFMLGANEAFQVPKSATLESFGAVAAFLLVLRRKPLEARSLGPGLLFLAAMLPSLLETPLLEASVDTTPVLADVDARTMNIDPADVERRGLNAKLEHVAAADRDPAIAHDRLATALAFENGGDCAANVARPGRPTAIRATTGLATAQGLARPLSQGFLLVTAQRHEKLPIGQHDLAVAVGRGADDGGIRSSRHSA